MRNRLFTFGVLLLSAAGLIAHPHIQKQVGATIGDTQLTLSFYTSPANMDHINNAQTGTFSTGYARLSLSAGLTSGGTVLPSGDYTIGAIKNGHRDWTMVLLPGKLGYGEQADVSKLIKLESVYSETQGESSHVNFDIVPGEGRLEGRTTIVWHFGSLHLSGAITDKQG